jgi:DNA-binding NarL/FixJ family response regulator
MTVELAQWVPLASPSPEFMLRTAVRWPRRFRTSIRRRGEARIPRHRNPRFDAFPACAAAPAAAHAPELEVLALLVAGQSNRKIAESLVLSERTVARHIANTYEKTGVHGRAEITAYALRHRLA